MSACKRCGAESQSMIGGFCLDCFPSFQTIGVSKKEDASMADIADLKADRDELRWALQGLLALYESPEDEIGGVERIMLSKVRKLLETCP